MKVLSRYIVREYVKVLVFCFLAVASLYLLAHFLGRIDEFIEYRAAPALIARLVLLKLPIIYYEVLPVVILLATLITLGLLSRDNEITALRACGVGLPRLVLPMLIVCVILASFSLIAGEWGVPYANRQASYLDDVALKKRAPIMALKKNRIWFRTGDNTVCNIMKVDPAGRLLHDVTLYTFNPAGDLITRLDAARVRWDGEKWITKEGITWTFSDTGAIAKEQPFTGPFPLHVPLEEMISVEKSPKEMGYQELREYIGILKREGYPTTSYRVDLYAKISYSLISIIMVFIGIPFALQISRRGGLALSIGAGLVLGTFYWIAYSVGLSLGHAGLLPPLLAAWLVNLLAGLTTLFWTTRVRY